MQLIVYDIEITKFCQENVQWGTFNIGEWAQLMDYDIRITKFYQENVQWGTFTFEVCECSSWTMTVILNRCAT